MIKKVFCIAALSLCFGFLAGNMNLDSGAVKIRIFGTVETSDGRELGEIKIKLFEVVLGRSISIKEVETTRGGDYTFVLGRSYFKKRLKIVPQYPRLWGTEHFGPRESLNSFVVERSRIEKNFIYSGPLPDLVCTNSAGPRHIVRCASIRKVGGGIEIAVSVANWGGSYAGPFRVMLKGKFGNKNELYVDFPGLRANEGSMLSEDVTRRVRLPHVSKASVRYVVIDVDNDVVESNERNNRIFGPF